jgi:hypothetical protein
MEAERPVCLPCARLGDLEYLPAGDAAVTRRATRYSERSAVVVRFSRSRGRYERQGILVEIPALQRAEQECSLDAEERAKTRTGGQRPGIVIDLNSPPPSTRKHAGRKTRSGLVKRRSCMSYKLDSFECVITSR